MNSAFVFARLYLGIDSDWALATAPSGEQLPVKHGSVTRAVPGWDIRVLDAEAEGSALELPPGEVGALAVKLPLPPRGIADLVAC